MLSCLSKSILYLFVLVNDLMKFNQLYHGNVVWHFDELILDSNMQLKIGHEYIKSSYSWKAGCIFDKQTALQYILKIYNICTSYMHSRIL